MFGKAFQNIDNRIFLIFSIFFEIKFTIDTNFIKLFTNVIKKIINMLLKKKLMLGKAFKILAIE